MKPTLMDAQSFTRRIKFCGQLMESLPVTDVKIDDRDMEIVKHALDGLKSGSNKGESFFTGLSSALKPIILHARRRSEETAKREATGLHEYQALAAKTGDYRYWYAIAYLDTLASALEGDAAACETNFMGAVTQKAIWDADGDPAGSVGPQIEDAKRKASLIVTAAKASVADMTDESGYPTPAPLGRSVFISYRRQDSSYEAGFLYNHLEGVLGRDEVFFDVDTIPIGANFKTHIEQYMRKCAVAVVIIGKKWMKQRNDADAAQAVDFVEAEVRLALELGLPIFPVLVQGAAIPNASELPPSIRPIVSLNAFSLRSGRDWNPDVGKIVTAIDGLRNI